MQGLEKAVDVCQKLVGVGTLENMVDEVYRMLREVRDEEESEGEAKSKEELQ